MKEMLIVLAKEMPEDLIIDNMIKKLEQYKLTKDHGDRPIIETMLLNIKWSTENIDLKECLKDFDKAEKGYNFFNTKEN